MHKPKSGGGCLLEAVRLAAFIEAKKRPPEFFACSRPRRSMAQITSCFLLQVIWPDNHDEVGGSFIAGCGGYLESYWKKIVLLL